MLRFFVFIKCSSMLVHRERRKKNPWHIIVIKWQKSRWTFFLIATKLRFLFRNFLKFMNFSQFSCSSATTLPGFLQLCLHPTPLPQKSFIPKPLHYLLIAPNMKYIYMIFSHTGFWKNFIYKIISFKLRKKTNDLA